LNSIKYKIAEINQSENLAFLSDYFAKPIKSYIQTKKRLNIFVPTVKNEQSYFVNAFWFDQSKGE